MKDLPLDNNNNNGIVRVIFPISITVDKAMSLSLPFT